MPFTDIYMKNCKLFLGTGNGNQVGQLDTLIQDKDSKITNIWLLLSDNILYIANDGIQMILRLINEIIVTKPCNQLVHTFGINDLVLLYTTN